MEMMKLLLGGSPCTHWSIAQAKNRETEPRGLGHEWREHGAATQDGTIRLYDILDRVSCWCCTNKNLDELRNVYHLLPEYWDCLKDLQRKTCRPMKGKGKSVFDLETRFKLEDARMAAGLSIKSKDFFKELASIGSVCPGGGRSNP